MWLLIAEAFVALALLVFIVWWTTSGRRRSGDSATDRADVADPAGAGDPDVAAAAPVSGPDGASAGATGPDSR